MAEFLPAYTATLKLEGGYVLTHDPDDKGGRTYGGISEKAHPEWKGWPFVDNSIAVPQVEHEHFFRDQFWDRLRLGELNDQRMASKIYDTAVNCGPAIAALWAQKACNIGGPFDLKVDGIVGKGTIDALNTMARMPVRRWTWFTLYETFQRAYYVDCVVRDASQAKFLTGWLSKRCTFNEGCPV